MHAGLDTRGLWQRLALVAALLVGGLLAATAVADGPQAFRYETPHYIVQTDTSSRFTEVVGRHMEEIFKEYSRRFKDYGEVNSRFNVAVFLTEEGYWKRVPPQVRGSTGVFITSQSLLAAHCQNRTPEEVLRTLYHEGFHQFIYSVVRRPCPIWLNEGLGEYFSEATWNGQGFTTGLVPTMRLHTVQEAIRNGSYIRLSDLFSLASDQWLQNVRTDARRASLHYSQAWSVVQFLVHANNGQYAGLLDQFLKDLSERRDYEDAFRRRFGTDVSAFEAAWAQYVMSLEPSPKFRCRDNMEAILLLANMVYGRPRRFLSVPDLRWQLLFRPRYRWAITRPTGQKITSDQRDEVARLFRCPFDQREDGISYLLVQHAESGVPVLVCDHHPGFIIKAYYRASPTGDYQPVVEEEVRETVSDGLRRAIIVAASAESGHRER